MQLEGVELKRVCDHSADLTEEARDLSKRDRNHYDGYQWREADKAELLRRKQPVITDNRIRRKIDGIVGLEQRSRTDPRALPRNQEDEEAADIATKALVFVDDTTRLDAHRSAGTYNLAIEGIAALEIGGKQARSGQIDPDITRIRFEDFFYDPYSRELDFSDAEYMGVQKWMSLERAIAFARGYVPDMPEEDLRAIFETTVNMGTVGSTFDDRPSGEGRNWGDRKNKRVRLAYLYYRSAGVWYLALVCDEKAIYNEVSPYLDENGEPTNPIVAVSCYIDQENRRYGIVRDMISLQEEINKRRSKLLHMINVRQTMGQRGAVASVAQVKRELSMPDGHVEYDQDPSSSVPSFQIVPQADQIAGQFSLLEFTTAALDNLGPNPAVLGEQSGATSGRAILAQQQAGMAELAPFYDAIRDWTLRVYRQVWCRIKQYWTEERWIRVTDDVNKLQFIGLNVPQVDPMTGMPAVDPATGQPIRQNEVGKLDVDIIIDQSPDYAILQDEQFEKIAELVAGGMLQLPPDQIIRMSSLRNKAELLEAMNAAGQSPEAQIMQQIQQQMMQLEMRLKDAEAGLKEAQAMKAQAEAQATMMEAGRPDMPQPGDPKPYLDADIKRAQLAETARQHDDKMALEAARLRMDAPVKAAQAVSLARPKPAAGERA
jgi:hypothetical protein